MTRDEVIDVLTAVTAADRRTVGNADVDVWHAVIGELPRDLALRAVRDHYRDRPDTWLQPGHVYQRVRAMRRDELEREPDSAREARQAALQAKAVEITETRNTEKPPMRPSKPNPLTARCPWCSAGVGQPCTVPGTAQRLRRAHPSRTEAVLHGKEQLF